MKTYIVNLPESIERRLSIENQLRRMPQLEAEFIEAFDGRKCPRAELEKIFGYADFRKRNWRDPNPGEIGCTYSHRRIYERVAESGKSAIVLEDDAFILRDFSAELPKLREWLDTEQPRVMLLGEGYMYNPLSGCNIKANTPLPENFQKRTVHPYHATGTYAYAINPAAARLLLSEQPSWFADAWRLFRSRYGLEVKALLPVAVRPASDEEHPSVLQTNEERRRHYTFMQRLYFFLLDKKIRLYRATGIFRLPERP